MRPLPLLLLLTLCLALSAPPRASAASADALLWSHEIQRSGGTLGVATRIGPRIEIRDSNAPSPVPLARLFAWLDLDAGHSGMRFTADATTDPDWPYFAHHLTDGVPHQVRVVLMLSSGSGSGYQIPGPEFPGMIITRAELQLGTVSLVSPGSNPNGDGNWTDYVFEARLDVYGTGPTAAVPSSWGRLKALYR